MKPLRIRVAQVRSSVATQSVMRNTLPERAGRREAAQVVSESKKPTLNEVGFDSEGQRAA